MNRIFLILTAIVILASCGKKGEAGAADGQKEDAEAKMMLQGVWLDDDTEDILFRMKGDSLYYPDSTSVPVRFAVVGDTLLLQGGETVRYKIDRRAAHLLWFHNSTGDVVKTHKSENDQDTMLFVHSRPQILTLNHVVKKDTVVNYSGDRYHCYVYVNPTHKKVVATSYTAEGVKVDNVYYDNVVHICVYNGANCLFSSDFSKGDFASAVPSDFLAQAVLTNVVFSRADAKGCHFVASIASVNNSSYYVVDVVIGYDGKMTMTLSA